MAAAKKGQGAAWDVASVRRALSSGFTAGMGLSLVSAKQGSLKLAMAYSPSLSQPAGLVHGGAIATLADTVAGAASMLLLPKGQMAVTSELKINYVGNVTKGVLIAEARLLHYGKRTLVWEVRVTDKGSKQLLAITLTTFFIVESNIKA
jgi:uncharacterized protein (TIGR00369 family)